MPTLTQLLWYRRSIEKAPWIGSDPRKLRRVGGRVDVDQVVDEELVRRDLELQGDVLGEERTDPHSEVRRGGE
jgi:hypothetical protein